MPHNHDIGPEDHHPGGKPKNSAFAKVSHKTQSEVHAATKELADGGLTVHGWNDKVDQALLQGHTDAWKLGRQRSGDVSPLNADDHIAGREKKDLESQWLDGFRDDIENGRYTLEDGTLNAAAIESRLNLYVGKLRGTANEAFAETSDDEDQFIWELRGAENHCEDCPDIAALSPFTKETLFAYPGSGDTECLGNCGCVLVRIRGETREEGFDRVDL